MWNSFSLWRIFRFVGKACRVLPLVGLAACANGQPQPYSPNYHYIDVPDGGAGMRGDGRNIVRKGYDKTAGSRRVLVPDACVTPDTGEYPLYLPRGCANNLNLQHMVADENDLMQGRAMGPAMAEPTARAARNYIDGVKPEDSRSAANNDVTTTSAGQ